MANKMLIDATHPEETRVVVQRGNRVEEFDFESAQRKQLRGNIYLAKVTRVEPSLQAAFIDYGGNRHGFLAFSEIHPDYYQIPVADRQALIDEEQRAQRAAEDEIDRRSRRHRRNRSAASSRHDDTVHGESAAPAEAEDEHTEDEHAEDEHAETEAFAFTADDSAETQTFPFDEDDSAETQTFAFGGEAEPGTAGASAPSEHHDETAPPEAAAVTEADQPEAHQPETDPPEAHHPEAHHSEADPLETTGGDGEPGEPYPATAAAAMAEMAAGEDATTDDDTETDALAARAAPDQADDSGPADPQAGTAAFGEDTGFEHEHAGHEHEHGHAEHGRAERRKARHGAAANGDADNGEAEHDDTENGDNGDEVVESVGGADALEEVPDRAPRYRRQYKIQEVIKRRQVMLVQVVKEERGTKGAALTTYLSLAGRYSVLMPNTARGGGISRKITNAEDRGRLKEVAQELEVPEGMGVILRTAGASRTKTEIKRDFEYLLRLWETVRDLTLNSTAPRLVYEEGSLVKRSIRDLYTKDIDEVVVAGGEAYHEAKDFMRMLMPSHAKNVKLYSDTQPLLSRYAAENQLDAMFSPVVQLRSGGYIVINQAEALVAIDVNSGRATREHHIEDTALKTNLEAADEIARQLRLRDLAGLIVIDFIDMDEKRNNRAVERRLKECLKQDRARIQVGRISHFGLLEMSRQRIRTSVLESSTEKCPYCGGSGHVRSVSSLALQVLRALEEQLMKGATHNLTARTRPDVALYVLNQKRAHLRALEVRFDICITVAADDSVTALPAFIIERAEQVHTIEAARALAEHAPAVAAPLEDEDDLEYGGPLEDEALEQPATGVPGIAASSGEERDGATRRRRRRRRGRGRDNGSEASVSLQPPEEADERAAASFGAELADDGALAGDEIEAPQQTDGAEPHEAHGDAQSEGSGERRRRRRGRRGGRRNRQDREHPAEAEGYEAAAEASGEFPAEALGPELADADLTETGLAETGLAETGLSEPDPSEPDQADSRLADTPLADTHLADTHPPAAVDKPDDGEHADRPHPALPESEPLRDAAPAEPLPADAPQPAEPHAVEADDEPHAETPEVEPAPPRRRRSTVREPVPAHGADTVLAPERVRTPEPVITEIDEGENSSSQPRTGWWSRRIAGS